MNKNKYQRQDEEARQDQVSSGHYQAQQKFSPAGQESARPVLPEQEIWEQALRLERLQKASELHDLAILSRAQGKYREAEPLFRRALHIKEQALGPEHSQVVCLLDDLANLYRDLGNYDKAELVLQRALQIREQAL